MNRLVRTELLKQRTTRTGLAGVLAAPALAGLMTSAILGAAGKQGNDPLGPDSLVQAVGGGGRHHRRPLPGPPRHRRRAPPPDDHHHLPGLAPPPGRAGGQAGSLLLTGAALGAMSVAVSAAVAMPWLHASGVTLDLGARLAGVAAGLVLSTALYAALGASVGALVRNQTAAVAAVLVWLLAIEGLLAKVFASWTLVHWLPGAAGRALVRAEDGLSAPAAAAAFATCVALFAVAAARISVPRGIT